MSSARQLSKQSPKKRLFFNDDITNEIPEVVDFCDFLSADDVLIANAFMDGMKIYHSIEA